MGYVKSLMLGWGIYLTFALFYLTVFLNPTLPIAAVTGNMVILDVVISVITGSLWFFSIFLIRKTDTFTPAKLHASRDPEKMIRHFRKHIHARVNAYLLIAMCSSIFSNGLVFMLGYTNAAFWMFFITVVNAAVYLTVEPKEEVVAAFESV